jgi:hypothetical protein
MDSVLTAAGKQALLDGDHNKNDTYMLALYSEDARIGIDTAAYTPRGEVKGLGYVAGGIVLKDRKSGQHNGSGYLMWLCPMRWEKSTIRASGALIYNASKKGLSLAVFSFGEVVSSTNGPFFIPTPPDDPDWAMVRID